VTLINMYLIYHFQLIMCVVQLMTLNTIFKYQLLCMQSKWGKGNHPHVLFFNQLHTN